MKRWRADHQKFIAVMGAGAVALLAFTLVLLHAASVRDPGPDARAGSGRALAAPVRVAQAAAACFSEIVRATGFLVPRAEAVVALTLDSYQVAEVFASTGDLVAKGQALARLARIGPAPSKRTGASPAAVAPSIVLRAPAAGWIVQSTATPGAVSSPRAEPLFRLAIDGQIEVDAEVSSIHLSRIEPEQTARIEIPPGREIGGRVRVVGSQIDPVTQMGHVRIALADGGLRRPGEFVRATIEARQSCGVAVPRSAIRATTAGASVLAVRGDRIEPLPVKVGPGDGPDAEIREGLRAGELVVAQAGGLLKRGDPVSPVLADDPPPAPERR